ncbi:MAG: GSCFA domain-containing protein [Planctomycetota bacterium]
MSDYHTSNAALTATIRQMRRAVCHEAWKRITLQANGRPIAIYGAGRQTDAFLSTLGGSLHDGPEIAFIIDDHASESELQGIPIVPPERADAGSVSMVLITSDAHMDALAERAAAWSAGTLPIDRLWQGLSDVTGVALFEDAGAVVSREHDGTRTSVGERGETVVSSDAPRPNRAPSAIDPITERRIWSYDGPEFKIERLLPSHDYTPDLNGYQFYPGDRLRPGVDLRDECPITRPEPGLVTPDTRVSVIGSCFAQNIRLWLIEHGYNFCQFEDGPFAEHSSVRTGPLFNTGSICQLFEWAFNGFDAADPVWRHEDRLVDPYRRGLSWASERDMHAERASHFQAVRSMVEESDVLVLTLGLSEVWRNREDKRCYFLIPPPGLLDEQYHEHALLTVDECVEHLERFYALIREHNPSLRLIVSLSPVPLMATYFDRHAIVSDAVSKATLRAAMHWFCERHPEIVYFPSYEIVTRSPDWPYKQDNRHVTQEFIEGVMQTFIEHYGTASEADRLREIKASAPEARLAVAGRNAPSAA